MSSPPGRRTVLLIGYGNPGRLDDGLGPALAEAVEAMALDGVTVDADYQLTVEHAEAVARHDVVIFVDAATEGPEPLAFTEIEPEGDVGFTTHSLQPQAVLALAHQLFAAHARGYLLAVRGYAFNEFGQSLSDTARANLDAAIEFVAGVLRSGNMEQSQTPAKEP